MASATADLATPLAPGSRRSCRSSSAADSRRSRSRDSVRANFNRRTRPCRLTHRIAAGILRVADALDMEQGRSRIAFERGRVGIHSLSAAAIEEVAISDGEKKPIRISITMNNSSGIYQVDGLLQAKLRGSGSSRTSRCSPTSTRRPRSASYRSTSSISKSEPELHWRPLRDRLMVGRLTLDQVV